MKENIDKKIVIIILILIPIIIFFVKYIESNDGFNAEARYATDKIVETGNSEIKTTSTGTKYIVDPDKIRSGGPPKGGIGVDRGIPALDENNIKFVSVDEADSWIQDHELVLALEYKGIKRVYPLQILTFHEIVNDVVADDPLLITYCPLCGSGIAYKRIIPLNGENKITKFGTSGKLFNSNLIMYDSETDTYWQQIDGKAIIGELTGEELTEITIDTVVWRDWKETHPDSEVLSQDTGMNRNYGRDPYANYFEDSFLIFPVENEDNRIPAKEAVVGIEVNGEFKAYREKEVKEEGIISDTFNEINLEIKALKDGRIVITNMDTGEEIVKERDFWFAWYAFHPTTELHNVEPTNHDF